MAKAILMLFVLLLLPLILSAKSLDVAISAKCAILMNAESGAVLYEKEAHSPAHPASTTKIATALYVLNQGVDLNEWVSISSESLKVRPLKDREQYPAYWIDPDGTTMGLIKGEKVTYETLLHGLMLVSGNDAANALAESIAGTVPQFMEEMNGYLQSIGCQNTKFQNPHGLTHPNHISTAYDMAVMTRKALQLPKFRQIVSTMKFTKPKSNKAPEVELKMSNALMRPKSPYYYSKAIGVKTGYTSAALETLVAAAEHQGRTLIAVILGCEKKGERYIEAKRLFEAAFAEEKEKRRLMGPENIFVQEVKGSKLPLKASPLKELFIEYFPAEEPKCKAALHWQIPSLPIRKGDKVGEVCIRDERGNCLLKADLLSQTDLKGDFFFMLKTRAQSLFTSETKSTH